MTQKEIVDIQLRELALTDWSKFKKLTGLDESKFIICMKKDEGKSISQIATHVRRSRSAVGRVCKVCP